MKTESASKTELPPRFLQFDQQYPAVMRAYEALGAATQEAGPLDPKTRELVKLGIAVGARSEGATHSHTRRALEAGATPEEIRHAVLLVTTTLGFPAMMAAMTWVEDVLGAGLPLGA
jgi:4-carboxymuconolactone decarboxylase